MMSQWLYCQSQDKRKPPARAHVQNWWLKATCTPPLCELCYLTGWQFATLKMLKQSTNSGAYDTGKTKPMILNGWFCFQMFVMQHKCTKDSPTMHIGYTTDAPWMHRGCSMEAPRMHAGRATDAVWMHYGCTTNSFTCTTDAPGMPHTCTTDILSTQNRCTRNASCMLYGCALNTI